MDQSNLNASTVSGRQHAQGASQDQTDLNASQMLAQRLYARYQDVNHIIPNRLAGGPKIRGLSKSKQGNYLNQPGASADKTEIQPHNVKLKLPKIQKKFNPQETKTLPQLPMPRSRLTRNESEAVFDKGLEGSASTANMLHSQSKPQFNTMSKVPSLLALQNTDISEADMVPRAMQYSSLQTSPMGRNRRSALVSPSHQKSLKPYAVIPSQEKLLQYSNPQPLEMYASVVQASTDNPLAMTLPPKKPTQLAPLTGGADTNKKSKKALPVTESGSVATQELMQAIGKEQLIGRKPSPLDFIRLVQNDAEFATRFCYCNRQEEFYEFEIVPFQDKNPEEYMTISSRGIVHFIKGDAQFMGIGEWERESRIYKQIKESIPFFQKYRTWKTFSAWKTLMRRTMIFKTSEILNRELFILDKELSDPLLQIRQTTFRIAKMDMVKMNTEQPRTIEQFSEDQSIQRDLVNKEINKISDEIRNRLVNSCDKSMKTFRDENRISVNENQDGDNDNDEAEPFLVGDETHKQMPFTQQATTRTHYRRLAKYIRLVDYMIIDSKLNLIQHSITNTLEAVSNDYSKGDRVFIGDKTQGCPLFRVEVMFQGLDLYFIPNKIDVQESIRTAIQEGITMVCQNEVMTNSQEFEQYMSAQDNDDKPLDDNNDLMTLAIGSESLISETEQIMDQIHSSFKKVDDFAQLYNNFVEIYDQNINMEVNRFRETDIEDFRTALETYYSQQQELEQLQNVNDIQIYRLDATNLRTIIKQSPVECIKQIAQLMPELAYERCSQLAEELAISSEKVKRVPSNVDDYVDIMAYLREQNDRMDNITTRFDEIQQLQIIISDFKIKMPERNNSRFKETQQYLKVVRAGLEEGLEFGEANEPRYKRDLENEIPLVDEEAKVLDQELALEMLKKKETNIEEACKYLEGMKTKVMALKNKGKKLNDQQKFLEISETHFESIENTYMDFTLKYKLWTGLSQWFELSQEWLQTQFNSIDTESINKQVDSFDKIASQCYTSLEDNEVTEIFKTKVDEMKQTMPVVTYLRDKALNNDHWAEIHEIIGQELRLDDPDLTMNAMIDMNIAFHKDAIGEIALKAQKQQELKAQFSKIINDWKQSRFEVSPYKDKGDLFIIGTTEELDAILEESLVQLSNILAARFVDIIRNEVEKFYKKLIYLENLLQEWLECQRVWMYLENIFASPDIIKSLPTESKKFMQVDQSWKYIMKSTNDNPLVMRILNLTKENYLEILKNNNKLLDEIQKSLENYLESKRKEFPRFFFLSNDELLLILAEANRRPDTVQPHLRKCFENIQKIVFGEDLKADDIISIVSSEGEKVNLVKPVKTKENVEKWLSLLEQEMNKVVRKHNKQALDDYEKREQESEKFQRTDWIQDENHTCQAICTISSVQWCRSTEFMLKEDDPLDSLAWWFDENVSMLDKLTALVRKPLKPVLRQTVVNLITQDVHYRDIVEQLRDLEVESINDFLWQQQLRYYFEDDVKIKQVNSVLDYGNEYLGATTRLVITPLTDRCWMTITGALAIKLGAAPAGPAGTGKTESTKDLAKALGKFCIVFNCSDQINYIMMGKLFTGLAYTGAWACLDEFNRIDIEVLSVIAQQLLAIRNAMLLNKKKFWFQDKEIDLNDQMGVFITMNPGYKGRQELPDNLKVLFRPVSMMIPDYALIAEIMLFAEGFSQAKALSKKMTKLYKLASEQLSQQNHYDFGMRAVKSVLVMAGKIKRADSDISEDLVLIRAMRDSNIPKFLKDDLPLFNAIIKDLFPESTLPEADYTSLTTCIDNVMQKEGLIYDEVQVGKIIEFYETMNVRFGLMIIGPTLSGKSQCYKVLQNAMNELNQTDSTIPAVKSKTLNPKSITMAELYGFFSHMTGEWTDGLASTMMRSFVEEEGPHMKWVIFDGPVDALWIENMNTVLDDNMTLCLSNGERIRLKPEMRMVFETDDLSGASPATVSRCGMVYAAPETLNWRSPVQTWINQLSKEVFSQKMKDLLLGIFENHIDNLIESMEKNGLKEPIPCVKNNYILVMCKIFESIATKQNGLDYKSMEDAAVKRALHKTFLFALTWSFGGAFEYNFQSRFESFLMSEFSQNDLPKGSVYDYYLQCTPETFGVWTPWSKIMPTFEFSKDKGFFELVVPTKDTVRYSWLLRNSLRIQQPIFFTGVTGVGKSIIVQSTVEEMKETDNYESIFMSFSSQTSSKETQNQIEDKLEKRKRNLLAGPNNKKVSIFIDDVNMPDRDEYGTQMPIELLRQYSQFGGMFDREHLFFKHIADCTLVCAAAPPGGGRKPLTQRFTRFFHMLNLPPTPEESLNHIFKSIVEGYMKEGFKPEVKNQGKTMVEAAMSIYNKCMTELLPTPAKSHYTFNLRDISKVFQGVLMAKPSMVNSIDKICRLWVHEMSRVFHDRLINDEDKKWFTELLHSFIQSSFRLEGTHEDWFVNQEIIFGDFMKRALPMEERSYEDITDTEQMAKVLMEYVKEYNMDNTYKLDLVLFKEALLHTSRVARILRQPRGSALLVGVGGSGKQTTTRLAAFMEACTFTSPEIKKNFTQQDFRDNMKQSMFPAGVEDQRMVFLINDNQITSELFLEDINNVLNSGEVPNLWESDEKDKIIQEIRDLASERGVYDNLYNYFISKVRDNLHIVLCLSPVGDAFRQRIRMFPSLVNCCTIDWVNPWPENALLSVSQKFIQDIDALKDDEKMQKALSQMCVYTHKSVERKAQEFYAILKRRVYNTPKSYLDLIKSYDLFLQQKQSQVRNRRNILFTGLSKLEETNEEVAKLKEELTKLQPILEQNAIEQDKLQQVLEVDKKAANQKKIVVEEEAFEVSQKAEEIGRLQKEAQDALDMAIPALEAATAAVSSINQGDIAELKMVKEPTPLVLMTFTGVCILLEEKTDAKKINWDMIKKMLANKFFDRLKNFNKDGIKPKTMVCLEKFIKENPKFVPSEVKQSSEAGKSLCEWVRAIVTYFKVSKEVEPKKKYVAEMNEQFSKAQAELNEKQEALGVELRKVEELERQFAEAKANKDKLEKDIQQTQGRLVRANKLTSGLSGERDRWKDNVANLDVKIQQLVGDIFISAACVSYYGPFTGVFRDQLTTEWVEQLEELGIPCAEKFSLSDSMGDPVQIQDWKMQGLPADPVSVNNGILVKNGMRKPLMIDPQLQGTKWIKTMGEEFSIKVIRLSDAQFLRTLESCIKLGHWLLIEDMPETTDPALEPILLNQTTKTAQGRDLVKIGDNVVEIEKGFDIFMATKIANPHFLPEIFIRVNIINFTVTDIGLEQQLLADIVIQERPEVEKMKVQLIMNIADANKTMKKIEDDILKGLAESDENILDDEDLVSNLEVSKIKSAEIQKTMEQNEIAQVEIENTRNQYQQVAERGSIIYFVIADLAGIDPMYQYSLTYFNKLFNSIIENSEKSEFIEQRIKILIKEITEIIFTNICRGLFNTHKLLFAFCLSAQILKKEGEITDPEWSMLLRGVLIDGDIQNLQNPDESKEIISDKSWRFILNLECTSIAFTTFPDHVKDNLKEWTEWIKSKEPQQEKLPGDWDEKLSEFQRMLVFKALREEKLSFLIKTFVEKKLGRLFAHPQPVVMDDVYKDSDTKTPVIFVLSPGADPMNMMLRFAQQIKGENALEESFSVISLGQGQDKPAMANIANGIATGSWVMLQNCHLYKSFMPELERKVLEIAESKTLQVNPDFRLFLTSKPADYFPVSILQNGIKVTNEPPKGVKANLTGTISQLQDENIDSCRRSDEYRKLVFGVCFFHAVVQERKKFGPLGWNIRYEFNESDLITSQTVIKNLLDEDTEDIVWSALQFITGEITYGGRVTDEHDRRCLMNILNTYITDRILESDYQFSQSGIYKCPPGATTVKQMLQYVESLPDNDNPELFGLNDNAEIAYQLQESNEMIETILAIQPRATGSSGGTSPDQLVDGLAEKIEEELPELLTKEGSNKEIFHVNKEGLMASLTTFLMQEMDRFNTLLQIIRSSVGELRKAIRGIATMSDELDAMYNSILNNKVPAMWEAKAYPSLKPLASWMENLKERVTEIKDWLLEGKPVSYWMSSFYFPQGFLTALMQQYSRKYKIAIDQLSYQFELMPFINKDSITKSAGDGVFVHGLYLESGRINLDTMTLEDALPGQKHSAAPVIKFTPKPDHVPDGEDYSCPVYKTSERAGTLSTTGHSTNFVVMIDVPSDNPPSFWVLRGTAFLCQLDD